MYLLSEKAELEAHITNIGHRNAVWEKRQKPHEAEIDKEMETHEDIILLDDVIDVYRNLPSKLLMGIKRYFAINHNWKCYGQQVCDQYFKKILKAKNDWKCFFVLEFSDYLFLSSAAPL